VQAPANARRLQGGIAIFSMLLILLVVLGALSSIVLSASSRAQSGTQQWTAGNQLVAQANLIRSKILDCSARAGNNGSTNHPSFPAATTAAAVSSLTCPASATLVFDGLDGVFLPVPPADFSAWAYTNTSGSVIIAISASSAANALKWNKALTQAAAALGSNASLSNKLGGSVNDSLTLTLSN